MEYAAIGLALFGALLGLRFRFRVLLPFLLLMLLISIWVVFARRLGLLESMLLVAASQAILQGSYFFGLAARATFRGLQHKLPAKDELASTEAYRSNARLTPPIEGSRGTHRT